MTQVSLVFQLGVNILEWIIMLYYFHLIAKMRNIYVIAGISIVYIAGLTYVNQQIGNEWLNLLISISGVLLLSLLFSMGESIQIFFIYDAIYVGLSILCELVGIFLCQKILHSSDLSTKSDYMFSACVSKILLVLCCYLVTWKKNRYQGKLSKSVECMLIASTLMLVGIMLVFSTKVDTVNDRNANLYLGATLACAYLEVMLYLLFSRLQKVYAENLSKQGIEQQIEKQKLYLDVLEAKEQELLRLRHDLKNQLLEFDVKLEGKHDIAYQDAKVFVNGLLKKCERATEYTANFSVNTVIKEKVLTAKSLGIAVSCQIEMAEDYTLEPGDMGVLLGNLFDNAMEAACGKEDGWIKLNIKQYNDTLYIGMENTFRKKPKDNFETTKKDTRFHGYGLDSIRKVAKKYEGDIAIDYDDKTFRVEVVVINGSI